MNRVHFSSTQFFNIFFFCFLIEYLTRISHRSIIIITINTVLTRRAKIIIRKLCNIMKSNENSMEHFELNSIIRNYIHCRLPNNGEKNFFRGIITYCNVEQKRKKNRNYFLVVRSALLLPFFNNILPTPHRYYTIIHIREECCVRVKYNVHDFITICSLV